MSIYGIQGGIGSFNEEAINYYLKKHGRKDYKIEYLYTTEKVLKELNEGSIDYGVFAISNTLGGLVDETVQVLGSYRFKVVEVVTININHFLMKRKDASADDITNIMAHPQVLKQCENTLAKDYAKYRLTSGEGDLIDTAKAAKALSEGELDKNIAILGPKLLSKIYDFDILAQNLQDRADNFTTFLVVEGRPLRNK